MILRTSLALRSGYMIPLRRSLSLARFPPDHKIDVLFPGSIIFRENVTGGLTLARSVSFRGHSQVRGVLGVSRFRD